jgi:hypothetical protein
MSFQDVRLFLDLSDWLTFLVYWRACYRKDVCQSITIWSPCIKLHIMCRRTNTPRCRCIENLLPTALRYRKPFWTREQFNFRTYRAFGFFKLINWVTCTGSSDISSSWTMYTCPSHNNISKNRQSIRSPAKAQSGAMCVGRHLLMANAVNIASVV